MVDEDELQVLKFPIVDFACHMYLFEFWNNRQASSSEVSSISLSKHVPCAMSYISARWLLLG